MPDDQTYRCGSSLELVISYLRGCYIENYKRYGDTFAREQNDAAALEIAAMLFSRSDAKSAQQYINSHDF